MVSFARMDDEKEAAPGDGAEPAEDSEMRPLDESEPAAKRGQPQQMRRPALGPPADQQRPGAEPDADELDEETLKRILACKRLSEGNCNRHLANLAVCRKNSLHMIGESLPPVTEGEPMRHLSHHMSQGIESSQSSSASSSSLRTRHLSSHKRNSQDENTNSCSSSTSLDGSGPRSPSRRRSSTVSQCSSVLSEGTRQQLNFDLSPDLAPDSSILEANALSPTDSERPASPEPSSLGSADNSFDMRPVSRMSQFCDELPIDAAGSPDSTLGDSNADNARDHDFECRPTDTSETTTSERRPPEPSIADRLERIITHVSEVKVSPAAAAAHQLEHGLAGVATSAGQKRAHTPFDANIQRNKATHVEPSAGS